MKPISTNDALMAMLSAAFCLIVIAAVLAACGTTTPARVITSDRPLNAGEARRIEAQVSTALPPACEATEIDVRDGVARFTFACTHND